MLDFSFGEIALVVFVALIIVGPKDLPVVMRAIGRWFGQFRSITDEFRKGFKSAMEDSSLADVQQDIHSIREEIHYIKDQNGHLQRVYDISDFIDERKGNHIETKPSHPIE